MRGLGFAVGEPVGSCMEKAGLAEKGFHTLHEQMDRNEFVIRLQALQAPQHVAGKHGDVITGTLVPQAPEETSHVRLRSPQIF